MNIPKLKNVSLMNAVSMLFIGLKDVEDKLTTSPGESVFSIDGTYRALYQLSKEFPEIFRLHFRILAGGPHSNALEDILFFLGVGQIALIDGTFRNYVVCSKAKESVKKLLLEDCGEKELRAFLPIIRRFEELICENKRNKGGV